MGKHIVFNSFGIHSVVQEFAKYFRAEVDEKDIEQRIPISTKHGTGEILALDFKDGLSILIFHGELKEDLALKYRCKSDQPLRLIFGVEHEITHSIQAEGLQYKVGPLAGSMVSGKAGTEQRLSIPANKSIFFYCIDIDRKKYHAKIAKAIALMPPELKAVFEDTKCKHPFFYLGSYGLGIAQHIQNIKQTDYKGVVRRVYIESQTLAIMGMLIKLFIDDLSPGHKRKVLRKRDMEMVAEAREKLLFDLVNPPTIRELAQMMGTNENKLKAGFRILYDTSINKLLQDERLSKAKMLITEEVFPIKEVAKMVGYKHSAHFASKFKRRFGILPNEFLKSIIKK